MIKIVTYETLDDIGCYIVIGFGAIGTVKIIGEYMISGLRLRIGRKELERELRELGLENIVQKYKRR